jgi:biopolymer transport protein ExbB/TolQ
MDYISYAKKAVVAGIFAAIPTFLAFNFPGWIDGTESFDWRSVAAAAVAAFVAGVTTYYATNSPAPSEDA